jgi:hypothetical protein
MHKRGSNGLCCCWHGAPKSRSSAQSGSGAQYTGNVDAFLGSRCGQKKLGAHAVRFVAGSM